MIILMKTRKVLEGVQKKELQKLDASHRKELCASSHPITPFMAQFHVNTRECQSELN